MARSVGWTVLKWVLIPIGLTALGYFVLGARMGRVLSEPKSVKPAKSTEDTKTSPPPSQTSYPAPDVDVKVGDMPQANPEETKPRRRRRHRPTPPAATPVKAPPPAAPPVDEGGSGGAVGGLDGGE